MQAAESVCVSVFSASLKFPSDFWWTCSPQLWKQTATEIIDARLTEHYYSLSLSFTCLFGYFFYFAGQLNDCWPYMAEVKGTALDPPRLAAVINHKLMGLLTPNSELSTSPPLKCFLHPPLALNLNPLPLCLLLWRQTSLLSDSLPFVHSSQHFLSASFDNLSYSKMCKLWCELAIHFHILFWTDKTNENVIFVWLLCPNAYPIPPN